MNSTYLEESKLNIILDGQFGSTGKGLFSSYLATYTHADMFVSNLSPNAGHTFYDPDGNKIILKQLPVGGILNKRAGIYLSAGSILDPAILLKEINEFNVDPSKIIIHPRAAIVEQEDKNIEKDNKSSVSKIASTQSGVGYALSRKITRKAKLAKDIPELEQFISEVDLMQLMDDGCTFLMETSQGFDLGLNFGLAYPYCTSRDMTVSSILSDSGVHPKYLGKVSMCVRTYPIRVGHIYDSEGNMVGHSGPFYNDSRELSWKEMGVEVERTTVTNRPRRIATFSKEQYERATHFNRPDYVFLNFCNYINVSSYLNYLYNIFKNTECPTHLGFGPKIEDVKECNSLNEFKNIVKNICFS